MKVLVTFLILCLQCCFLPGLFSQIDATIFEINPDNSTLDPSDPDGATGGRVNGLGFAADGSAYFAASEWGGIYRSTDNGLTWVRLNGHLPTATWDVAVDPTNPNKVYATSFYDGRTNSLAGINVSYDGGNTWVHPPTAVPPGPPYTSAERRDQPSAFGIAIDPDNANNVFIGTNAGLAISNDAGGTWRFVDPTPGDLADDIWDVIVQPGGLIDLVGDDGHRRSTDRGTTWTTAVTGPPLPGGISSITASPDESYVLFATVGTTIYESDDGGDSWSTLVNPSPQGRIPFVKTNQRSGNTYDLWFGDVGLWRTTCTTPASPAPGGAPRAPVNSWTGSFTRATGGHDDCADIVFDPTTAVDACPVLFSSDGGVYYNTLAGGGCHSPVWEQPNVTPHGLWLFGMSGAEQAGAVNEDLYFGNQDNGTFATGNAGAVAPTWNNQDCCDGFDVESDPARVLYSVCCFGAPRANRLFLRNTGMTGGGEINTYPPGNIPGFRPAGNIARFGPTDYALLTTAGLFITNDITAAPIVWTQLGAATSPTSLRGLKVSFDGATPTFYIQRTQGNLRNQDQIWRFEGTGAGSWEQVNPPGGGGFSVYDVDPSDPDRIIACNIRNFDPPQMVMTDDGGTTWRNLFQLDDLMTGDGAFLYQNQRGPTNFTGFGGYPQPSLLAIDPDNPNIIVAGGADSGVFISNDGGICWTLITDPLNSGASGTPHIPRPQFAYFSHQPSVGGDDIVHLYIGSQGRGVWRAELRIEGYPATTLSAAVTPPDCPGGCDGQIDLTPSGGTPPYSYIWSNGTTNQDATGLCEGDYSVIVRDQLGCVEASFSVPDGVDNTPPVITCPADISVPCDTTLAGTGAPLVVDNCDPAPAVVYSDAFISGNCDWACVIERTFTATDMYGNAAACTQTIEKDLSPLIEDAIDTDVDGDGVPDPLVLGFTQTTLTLVPADAPCVTGWFPYDGTTPSPLRPEKASVEAGCLPGTNPLNGAGKITNPLLGEALKLAIILRLDPSFGETPLKDLGCAIHPIVLQTLDNDPTLAELMEVTNFTLGNLVLVPHRNFLLDALTCIAGPLDPCDFAE